MKKVKIKKALISVTNKDGLDNLAKLLHESGVEIVSTGGTKIFLEALNIPVTSVEKITGNPEAFGGRMKSISFQIGSALLFRRNNELDNIHAKELGIEPIDLVVCNLYPFVENAKRGVAEEVLVENIDIGGPMMLRAAAKNFEAVTVLSSVADYDEFYHAFQNEEVSLEFRKSMAAKTFKRIADYDIAIADELMSRFNVTEERSWLTLDLKDRLRYGENPHQDAKIFKIKNTHTEIRFSDAEFIQGKELSYNNWMDADAAWRSMSDIYNLYPDKKVVSIIKHANPCGLAASDNLFQSLRTAWMTDSVSSFGGILAFSHEVDSEIAQFLNEKFIEVIIAPEYSTEALKIFTKKKNIRVLKTRARLKNEKELMLRSVSGALLIQDEDESFGEQEKIEFKTKCKFPEHLNDLLQFGIFSAKHLKSNAILLVGKTSEGVMTLVGTGMGQPNRLDSLRKLAVPRALDNGFKLAETILISDAFFPFKDSIEVCHEVGIRNIIQPGGSIRDQEVIDACNEFGIAMGVTGKRHFRH